MTNKLSCNCHSYNWQEGTTPNVVLPVPANIRCYTDGRETVCIDACIAGAVKALWESGLPTLNSCCGHNRENPGIVIPDGFAPNDYLEALAEVDGREWVVYRWERVEYRKQSEIAKEVKGE